MKKTDGLAPFRISGADLVGKRFDLDVASAQVETAILLAGLQASGTTTVKLPFQHAITRDECFPTSNSI